MTHIDRKILTALQADGRLSNVELADEAGFSPSPCLRRVRRLEWKGYIEGYRAALRRDADYFLKVAVPDLAAYQRSLVGKLLNLPIVREVRSNIAIQTLKTGAPLPLGHLE